MMNKNYRLVLYYLSVFIFLIGIIQLLPLLVLPFYPEEIGYAKCFIIPGILSFLVSYLMKFFLRDTEIIKLEKHYDSILVVSVWILAIVISSFPWMISGDYNFTQAMFEMTSGFSTTGLSVVDVVNCPHIFLMFRSITLFVGGIGLVLILTCTLSDRYGLNIYHAEGHNDRLMPNLTKSARFIMSLYSVYILIGSIAYVIAGMSVFDAINTSIAALSTGGFSTNALSIYGYHSLPIEIITMILMLLGMTNFLVHLSLLKGKFKNAIKNSETKFFAVVFVIALVLMVKNLLDTNYCSSYFESLRYSVFQLITSITTTGFVSTKDLTSLPSGFVTVMILLMLIGGDIESTAGGIKQYRVIVALKGIYNNIKGTVTNSNVVETQYIYRAGEKKVLSEQEKSSNAKYVLFYIILFFIGSLIFTMHGYNLQDSMFEFSSALSTVGLSVGITNYNACGIILWTGIIGMFFGRLEIMVIFETFIKIFKDMSHR